MSYLCILRCDLNCGGAELIYRTVYFCVLLLGCFFEESVESVSGKY